MRLRDARTQGLALAVGGAAGGGGCGGDEGPTRFLEASAAARERIAQDPSALTNPANFEQVNRQVERLGLSADCRVGPGGAGGNIEHPIGAMTCRHRPLPPHPLQRLSNGRLARPNLHPVSFDPAAFRRESAQRWERAAQGWAAHRAAFQTAATPVSKWMVDAIDPQPGHRVLELAAGTADTGLMAAQRVRPGGTLIATDVAEAMLDGARARAGELELGNVEFRAMDAEWIDRPAADVDAVLCRFGIMLLADPAACAREVRRVLRPGGRLALATWTTREENPWSAVPNDELIRLGAISPPEEGRPGQFSALSDPACLEELLLDAGLVDVEVDQVDLTFSFDDLDAWWDQMLDMSMSLRDAVAALSPQQRDDLREVVDTRLAGYVGRNGRVDLPGRANVARAEA